MKPVLIFDIDGTLLDTLRLNMVTLLELVHELGFKNEDGHSILRYASHPGMQVMHEFGLEKPEEAYARWVQKVRAFPEQAQPYPGVVEMIKSLHASGYRLAIVSSKRRQQYEIEFIRLALIDYFEVAVLADDSISKNRIQPHCFAVASCWVLMSRMQSISVIPSWIA